MEGFAQAETLSGDNQYFCDKCQKKCDAHKVGVRDGARGVVF